MSRHSIDKSRLRAHELLSSPTEKASGEYLLYLFFIRAVCQTRHSFLWSLKLDSCIFLQHLHRDQIKTSNSNYWQTSDVFGSKDEWKTSLVSTHH